MRKAQIELEIFPVVRKKLTYEYIYYLHILLDLQFHYISHLQSCCSLFPKIRFKKMLAYISYSFG